MAVENSVYKFGNIDPDSPTLPYSWEKFEFKYWRYWMSENFHLPVTFALFYVVLIFVGQFFMKDRAPKKLRNILILWNFGFALFSLVAFIRTVPDLFHSLSRKDGFYHSVCSSEGQSYPYAFWSWVGTFSKVVELGDTAFLVLRKHKPIIFLHWYHHATAMLYTWFIFETQEPCHRWLMTMNFFIHVLMYSYFGLRAAGLKLPKSLAMMITTLQITQMFMGVYINWYTWRALVNNQPCDRSEQNLRLAFVMYASYLVLFMNFFYNSYFKSKPKDETTKKAI